MEQNSSRISKNYYYYIISFIEGGAVMGIELLGAKIIAPYYGASLYVWSSVLGVTLGGLALGYFLGGRFSSRYDNPRLLFLVLMFGGCFAGLSPIIAPSIMSFTDFLGVRMGSLVSVLFYLSPSLICMGMVSPIIIQLLNKTEDKNAGKIAGSIYAISTVGGIIITFLFGFYFIPEFGIKFSSYLIGSILSAIGVIYFILTSQYKYILTWFGAVAVILFLSFHFSKNDGNASIKYDSSGLFGQLTVVDIDGISGKKERLLMLNRIVQTRTLVGYEPISLWDYPNKIATVAGILPTKSKALILGMGGGSLAYEFNKLGFEVDLVELDDRIPFIVTNFFNYDSSKSNLIVDDARHYTRTTKNKYDLVVFDVLKGEVQPSYVFTLESFKELKSKLNPGAIIIINFQGKLDKSESSVASRSIYKTLIESGFKVNHLMDYEYAETSFTDIILIASEKGYDFKSMLNNPRYHQVIEMGNKLTYELLFSEDKIDISDVVSLVDDKPMLDYLTKSIQIESRERSLNRKKL